MRVAADGAQPSLAFGLRGTLAHDSYARAENSRWILSIQRTSA